MESSRTGRFYRSVSRKLGGQCYYDDGLTFFLQGAMISSLRSWPSVPSVARKPLPMARRLPERVDVCLLKGQLRTMGDSEIGHVGTYSTGKDQAKPMGKVLAPLIFFSCGSEMAVSILSAIQSKNWEPRRWRTELSIL